MISLSLRSARKLVLTGQKIHREHEFGTGRKGLIRAVEHLGYIQIDTISVVERAHHHTCWNRVRNYQQSFLDEALTNANVFEYWSHAAAYLAMRDYRFSLPRKQNFLEGEKHWYERDPKQMKMVLDRIRGEGALQARDFDQQRGESDHAWGGHKPAKMALEQLFMQGELMVSQRRGFQKVYDLTERIVPSTVNQLMPSNEEYCDHLIYGFLNANGIATAGEISYLRKGMKLPTQKRCQELVEDKRLVSVEVGDKAYFVLSGFEAQLAKKLSRRKVRILSPFDNVLIQRQRMRDLFDFDYQIECYVPASKRRHGYFVLPILRGQEFIGRMDAKMDRKTRVLTVHKLFLETSIDVDDGLCIKRALVEFSIFNKAEKLQVNNVVTRGSTGSLNSVKSIFLKEPFAS